MSFEKESKIINHLIEINYDACKFYQDAAAQAENPKFVQTFGNLEHLHRNVVEELSRLMAEQGIHTDIEGSLKGAGARLFGELAAKISNDTDETLVSHLEEAEDRCLHSMEDAVKKDIRPDVKATLLSELSTLRKTHDYMKSLKDSMKAA